MKELFLPRKKLGGSLLNVVIAFGYGIRTFSRRKRGSASRVFAGDQRPSTHPLRHHPRIQRSYQVSHSPAVISWIIKKAEYICIKYSVRRYICDSRVEPAVGNFISKSSEQEHVDLNFDMDLLSKGIGLGLEPLSCNEAVPIDYEQTLFQVLVNEGKHIRVSGDIIGTRLLTLKTAADPTFFVHTIFRF